MSADRRDAGFSLVELLAVVAIIAIMAAVALPSIARYVRNYRIKAATQQVAGELQSARMKAISKNVNLGVVFAIVSNTQYGYAVEDDLNPQRAIPWTSVATEGGSSWTALIADPAQAGPLRTLPLNLQFDSPANCNWPATGAAPNDWGIRFSRLGGACKFGGGCGPTPPSPPAYTNYVFFAADGTATICLRETVTNLRRAVIVASGGRILGQP
jgi:prepilin-type N-terminal cleavage/methylation domain-containing protein